MTSPPGGWQPTANPYAFPEATGYQPVTSPERTSGFAIASLVLSIVWVAGLGSVLAVIFAIIARRRISRSGGRLGGGGLSMAGLIVGIVGIVGGALFWVAVGLVASSYQNVTVAAGQPVHVQGLLTQGVTTMTVYGVQQPVTPSDTSLAPAGGYVYAAADVKICAGADGARLKIGHQLFRLVLADGTQVGPTDQSVESPAFSSHSTIAANSCRRAFVSFSVPSGATATSVVYRGAIPSRYAWTLSTSS